MTGIYCSFFPFGEGGGGGGEGRKGSGDGSDPTTKDCGVGVEHGVVVVVVVGGVVVLCGRKINQKSLF